jgi:hypothetical protein
MMTTYDFTGANGDPLPDGLTAANGDADIQNNQCQTKGAIPSGTPQTFITAASQADGSFSALITANTAASGVVRVIGRSSDNTNFISVNFSTLNGEVKLYKYVAGAATQLGATYAIVGFSAATQYKIELVASGSSVSAKVDNVTRVSPVTEAFNQTETTAGFSITNATASVDDFIVESAAATGIVLDLDSLYGIVSLNELNREITVPVAWTTLPTTIEYSLNSGAWTTGIPTPSGVSGSFNLTIPIGTHTLKVRRSDGALDESATSTVIIAEKSILACGQSNISGASPNDIAYVTGATSSVYLLGNDDVLKVMQNPWDSDVGQVDAISSDSTLKAAWMLAFANDWSAGEDTPVIIIPACKSGTGSWEWQKTSTDRVGGLNLYESAIRRAALSGGVTDIFYEQGERDANDAYLTIDTVYKNNLIQFAADMFADVGANTFIIPLHTLTSGTYDGNGTTTGQIPIRAAQLTAESESSYITVGQSLADIDISVGGTDDDGDNDGVHFMTAASMTTVGQRVYESFAGLVSSINITATGIPSGDHVTYLVDVTNEALLPKQTLTYADGAATATLGVNIGTRVLSHVQPTSLELKSTTGYSDTGDTE